MFDDDVAEAVASELTTVENAPVPTRATVTFVSGVARTALQYRRAYVIVAPVGIASSAVLPELASGIEVLAAAAPLASSESQKTSAAVSAVFVPHAPTTPTTGAGTPGPQS
jgi:hypothetical protein